MLIPVSIQTLILSHNPAPSVLVLQPTNEVNPSKNGRIIPIWIYMDWFTGGCTNWACT